MTGGTKPGTLLLHASTSTPRSGSYFMLPSQLSSEDAASRVWCLREHGGQRVGERDTEWMGRPSLNPATASQGICQSQRFSVLRRQQIYNFEKLETQTEASAATGVRRCPPSSRASAPAVPADWSRP